MPENSPGGNKKRPQIKFSMYWMYVFIGMFLVGMWYVGENPATKKVTYSEFENYITDSINSHAHGITKIIVEKRKGTAEAMLSDSLAKVVFHENQIKSGSPAVITTTLPSTDEFARKIDQWKQDGIYTGPVDYDEGSDFGSLLWNFGPILILIAFWFFIMRRMTNRDGGPGGVFSVGKSKAQVFDKDNAMKVTFADVAGLSEAKTEIEEIVEFLKNPGRYTDLGGKIPKGALLVGPPGTGKTTLAKVIANTTSARFTQLNATTAGKKDMEEVVKEAQQHLGMYGKKTILFVDEIHRFNKGQQDYLLPFVEDGTLVLIGATTENPYFEVNGALLSRSIIFELKSLEKKDIRKLLDRAVTDPVKGLGSYHAEVSEEALDFLADLAGGDARAALNAIELGVLTTERSADGKIHVDLETAQECIQKRVVRYDKTGDQHYDTISAFIKSMRGSDPDAAVYYLAKMLYAGEDIKFIARRIMICAAEDVGMADPQALVVATAAAQAVERIGMPEAQIILSEAVTYVATAPKSNTACEAVFAAMASVKKKKTSVPAHLQDAHYKGSSKLGHGVGYLYAHDYPEHYVKQQYLPDEIKEEVFYHPTDIGYEKQAGERLRHLREREE